VVGAYTSRHAECLFGASWNYSFFRDWVHAVWVCESELAITVPFGGERSPKILGSRTWNTKTSITQTVVYYKAELQTTSSFAHFIYFVLYQNP
jgi:hypothetical protein